MSLTFRSCMIGLLFGTAGVLVSPDLQYMLFALGHSVSRSLNESLLAAGLMW